MAYDEVKIHAMSVNFYVLIRNCTSVLLLLCVPFTNS